MTSEEIELSLKPKCAFCGGLGQGGGAVSSLGVFCVQCAGTGFLIAGWVRHYDQAVKLRNSGVLPPYPFIVEEK